MKKRLLFFISLIVGGTLCGKSQENYTLTIKFPDSYNGRMVYILPSNSTRPCDSARVESSVAVFRREFASEGEVCRLRYDLEKSWLNFIEEKGSILFEIVPDHPNLYNYLTGGSLNEGFHQFNMESKPLLENMDRIVKEANKEVGENGEWTLAIYNRREAALSIEKEKLLNLIIPFARKYSSLPMGKFVMQSYLYLIERPEQLEEIRPFFDSDFQEYLKKRIEGLKMTMPGTQYTDVGGLTPLGVPQKLSDYMGTKIILVDFWASWCGPCRRTFPTLKSVYEEFKEKGFEIVGISLDHQKENWIKAIEEDGLSWPHLSNLTGWNDPAAAVYRIRSIPSTLLLNKEGVIMERDIPHYILKAKLEDLLK